MVRTRTGSERAHEPKPTQPPKPDGKQPDGSTLRTLKRGDSLSALAKEHYGDASLWPVIAAAEPG